MGSKENSLKDFLSKEVYDLASNTGIYLYNEGVKKTQVENIIEVFESEFDSIDATKLTIAFIVRQLGRKELPDAGKHILRNLKDIYNKFKSDPKSLGMAIRKYLYLIKWFYESKYKGEISNFDDFINKYLSIHRQV